MKWSVPTRLSSFPLFAGPSKAAPYGRGGVLAVLHEMFFPPKIEYAEPTRRPYPCPMCGGVVFPTDPGRGNDQKQHGESKEPDPAS